MDVIKSYGLAQYYEPDDTLIVNAKWYGYENVKEPITEYFDLALRNDPVNLLKLHASRREILHREVRKRIEDYLVWEDPVCIYFNIFYFFLFIQKKKIGI